MFDTTLDSMGSSPKLKKKSIFHLRSIRLFLFSAINWRHGRHQFEMATWLAMATSTL